MTGVQTCALPILRAADFSNAFTFEYSKRPGTPAADLPDQVPAEVVTERYLRLVELVNAQAWRQNQLLVGSEVEVLISQTEGKKDEAQRRLSGRSRDGRLVHVAAAPDVIAGDVVTARVTYAAPHHLIADDLLDIRRRAARDAASLLSIVRKGA